MKKNDCLANLYSMRSNLQYQVDEHTKKIHEYKLKVRKAQLALDDELIQKYIKKHAKNIPLDDAFNLDSINREINKLNDDVNEIMCDIDHLNEVIVYVKNSDAFDYDKYDHIDESSVENTNIVMTDDSRYNDNAASDNIDCPLDENIPEYEDDNTSCNVNESNQIIDSNMIMVDKFVLFELQNQLIINVQKNFEKLLYQMNKTEKYIINDTEKCLFEMQSSINQAKALFETINQIIFNFFD